MVSEYFNRFTGRVIRLFERLETIVSDSLRIHELPLFRVFFELISLRNGSFHAGMRALIACSATSRLIP